MRLFRKKGDGEDRERAGSPPVYGYLGLKQPADALPPPQKEPESRVREPEPLETYESPALEPVAAPAPAVAESPPPQAEAAAPAPEAVAAPPPADLRTRRRLTGYSLPLTSTGRSSLVPAPPWHYSGDLLVIEYEVDVAAARSYLPPELEPGDDPGAAAAIFADWQSCSDSGSELLDPIRAQYKEFYIVLSAKHGDEPVTRCPLMWVDKGFSLARGWLQGFPKKPGSIWMTRPVTVGKAGPKLEPGARFGATCASNDRRIAEASLTIRGLSEKGPTVNTPPLVNTRLMRPWDPEGASLEEHVLAGGRDREVSPIWEGDATLRFFDSPADEIGPLAPINVGRGFWLSFGYTVDGGKRLQ